MKVSIENCYGIGKLDHEFDFAKTSIYLIYAQNGVFKTSFAKTLKTLIDRKEPKDEIFADRKSKTEVFLHKENEGNQKISQENALVLYSYVESFSSKESVSAFVASEKLKTEYERIISELEKQKKELIKNIKNDTGSSDCEKEILKIFSNKNFYEVLSEHLDEIKKTTQEYSFKYHDIFDDKGKVEEFLKSNQKLLDDYFNRHNELLEQSNLFKNTDKGTFGTYQVETLQKALKDGRFFGAEHQLFIANQSIKTNGELESLIQSELKKVLQDQKLRKTFDDIDSKLNKNEQIRGFKDAIDRDNGLLLKLKKYEDFRKEVIFSYLNRRIEDVQDLVSKYLKNKDRIREIVEEAKKEQEDWKEIITTFNARFFVPFRVEIANQEDLVLKGVKTAVFRFEFVDDDDGNQEVEEEKLKNLLSQGEKRALYILQIIFEIESRKKKKIETLLVFDDIADSFDYRNKYAIIEYLNDLKESSLFKMIVMTHNFDFYRTLASRLEIKEFARMVHKDKNKRNIEIKKGEYLNDFTKYLLQEKTKKAFVALIPFVRNIVEYRKCVDDNEVNRKDYDVLTKCLHIKYEDTQICNIQNYKILEIFKRVFGNYSNQEVPTELPVFKLIDDEANKIIKANKQDNIDLQNKIILSIATRLKAERFMLTKLSEDEDRDFGNNQTRELFEKFKLKMKKEEKELIHKVLILVSENIHINSFMYEPILDTSLEHLIKCYEDLENLSRE